MDNVRQNRTGHVAAQQFCQTQQIRYSVKFVLKHNDKVLSSMSRLYVALRCARGDAGLETISSSRVWLIVCMCVGRVPRPTLSMYDGKLINAALSSGLRG
jgi:hypothetical protein